MRNYRVSGFLLFVLFAFAVGCNKISPTQQPGRPVASTPSKVPVVATGAGGLAVIEIKSKADVLEFSAPLSETEGFTVTFPTDAQYPAACAPASPIDVCPGESKTCNVNPAISAGHDFYYKIRGGLECSGGPANGPHAYSVVRCPPCN